MDEYLEVCHPHLFAAQLHRPILANLKHLRIESDDFEPNHLNAFAQLVHLEVYYSIFPNTKIEWSLPNLKILKFRSYDLYFDQISIDCPKLQVLSCDCGEDALIDLKWPETITTLCADFYGSRLAKFKNTETYKCKAKLEFVNDALIHQLPKLRVLEIVRDPQGLYYKLEESADRVRWFLKRLLSDRKKVLRSDLRLFLAGIEIRDEALVDHLDLQVIKHGESFFKRLSNEHLYFGNYPAEHQPNLQEKLEFVKDADYNTLMSLVNEIPRGYFERFYNVRYSITAGNVQDPNHFASYLSRLEHVESLELHYTSLQQEWYDRLPTICNL